MASFLYSNRIQGVIMKNVVLFGLIVINLCSAVIADARPGSVTRAMRVQQKDMENYGNYNYGNLNYGFGIDLPAFTGSDFNIPDIQIPGQPVCSYVYERLATFTSFNGGVPSRDCALALEEALSQDDALGYVCVRDQIYSGIFHLEFSGYRCDN